MILIDLNQVMIANLMMQLGNHKNAQVDENMLRHMILNTIRSYKMKFGAEYGEMIICADDKNYWRRKYFPYYKAARRKSREESELDWATIFQSLNKVREELKEFFPYKVIQIETAEADDIIGVITHHEGQYLNTGKPILILSSDKDYIQLHIYANVKQYDPARKRWIKHADPVRYLYEHIAKGDTGDGIPNILSPDNAFVIGARQRPMTQKRLELFEDINNMSDEIKRNWKRNETLVDLKNVPDDLKEEIMKQYNKENDNDRSHLFDYFIKNKLKNLMESIGEF